MVPRTKYCCLLPRSAVGWSGEDNKNNANTEHPDDVRRLDDTLLSSSDDGDVYDASVDAKTKKSDGRGLGDRSHQTGDSDYDAVEWMRHRSAESSSTTNSNLRVLSERAQKEWTRRGRPDDPHDKKTRSAPAITSFTKGKRGPTQAQAREESIEVDDLSLFGIRILDHRHNSGGLTASSSSSAGAGSGMSFDPWRNSFLVDEDLVPSTTPAQFFPSASASTPDEAFFGTAAGSPKSRQQPDRRVAATHLAQQANNTSSMLSDAEEELDAIIESFSSQSIETRRHANRRRTTAETPSSNRQGRGLRTKEYRTASNDLDRSAITQEGAASSRWSPRRPMSATFRPRAAGDNENMTPTKSNEIASNIPSRYVMEALPRRSLSPKLTVHKQSPRSHKESGRRHEASRSESPRRKLQDLRALDPILPAVLAADDALSNVPSDVDPATTQRYLRACRLLKSALIERDTSLLPQERAFLNRLLEEPGGIQKGPVDLDEQASAIETASFTLMSDPLFQVESVNSSTFAEFEDVRGKRTDRRGSRSRGEEAAESSRRREPAPENTNLTSSTPSLVVVDERHPDRESDEAAKVKAKAAAAAVARFDGKDYPFYILGVTPDFKVGALTPTLMESLRGFFPPGASEENFFLKFSLQRDGPSLPTLLSRVRTSRLTVIAVETTDGYVFGAFCSAPWRTQAGWFGNDDSFLWRLKRPRFHERSKSRSFDHDCEIEVYPVFRNTRIQYCTSQTLAVGGGEWGKDSSGLCPYPSEPAGIGFIIDGDLMGGETNSCSTFCNPRLGQRVVSKGGNEFDVRCLEVWTVTPAVTIEEAENIEMHRHFVR